MELQQVIDEFIVYNDVEKCVSPLSVMAYKSDLRGFVRHWSALGLPDDIGACTMRLVRQCMTAMHKNRKYKTTTVNRRVDTLRSFFRFAVEQGYLSESPMDKIRAPKPEKTLPIYLREDEAPTVATGMQEVAELAEGQSNPSLAGLHRLAPGGVA